ncbi:MULTISPECIES: hypothetical protein [unclassified Streptomyces]|uniref:hypothetical protein n=1 Tax=unclassified Streptomyces TaxID=2593676 RepID=UPI00365F5438
MNGALALCGLAVVCLIFHGAQYLATRRMEALVPPAVVVEVPRHPSWSAHPGAGRHRRDAGAPDAWLACHNLACAHLTRPHTRTPAGLVCDECGHVIPGEPVHDHHDYADEVDYPTREEEKAAEIALDVADEERWAAEAAAAPAEPEDENDCGAEFIDGSWAGCGCEDCADRDAEEEEL